MNYFTIHRPSNLICGVIASSSKPADSSSRKFVFAPDRALSTYYRLLSKNDAHIDVGHLMAKSEYVNDAVVAGRSGDAMPQTIRYRAPESYPETPDRESLIFSWIASQPDADEWVLSAAFNLGTVAAKAYLTEYRLTK